MTAFLDCNWFGYVHVCEFLEGRAGAGVGWGGVYWGWGRVG